MLILTLLITTITVLFFTWYFLEKRKYKNLDEKLPGPPVKFLRGNIGEFGNNIYDIFNNCQRLIKTYGKVLRIWQGPLRMNVFITDPKLVECFLTSQVHIKKSIGYDIFKSWLGDGLINSSGKIWMKYRKILSPAFHFGLLDQFGSNFYNNSETLIEILKKQSGKEVNLLQYIKLYVMDSICETSMAVNFRSQEAGKSNFITCVDSVLDTFLRRFFSAFKRYDSLFALTSESKEYEKKVQTLHDMTLDVIQRRRKELKTGIIEDNKDEFGIRKQRVFIDILLENGNLSDQEIEWQVNTFMFAGLDTVGSCLSYSLYELAKHKEIYENIRKEIITVVGEDRDIVITTAMIKELHYLDLVLKECLRMYPPLVIFERELLEDVKIGDLEFPKGTTISFHPYAQHHDPDLFPNPEVFDPNRFLPENSTSRHPFAYIPFSAGPRNCIGQKYAVMNIKIALVNIIRNFDISPSDKPHSPIMGIGVIQSKNGLPIKITYRK